MSLRLNLKNTQENEYQSNLFALGLEPLSTKEKLGLVSLEPRILLDAAGFVTGAEIAMDTMASEDAQFGVDVIFEDSDVALSESSNVELQNTELLNALSIAPINEGDADPTAAPADHPWLITDSVSLGEGLGGDDPTAAPADHPWL